MVVKETAKKATLPFVFEPNDPNTWTKVRSVLENYLTGLWEQGALAGTKREQAFFVRCGLDSTMTALDILEGRLIIEIGIAPEKPAEFMNFMITHNLQVS